MPDEPQFQEGAFRGGAADEPHRVDEREQREADDPHLVAHVHGLPGHGRAHDRGPRRPEARTRVHLRADGRPQAGRVRANPDLPRPLGRPQDRGEEARMSVTETPREVRAQAKYVRMSPRKARLVAEHIRGRSVPEARAVLAFTSREAAGVLQKVLQSAVSNAEANHGIAEDRLYVKATFVDGGPVMKRWRARARGRVARIRKRTCHITVQLAEMPQAAPAVEPAQAEAAEAAKAMGAPARKKTAAASKKKTASKRPAKKKGVAT